MRQAEANRAAMLMLMLEEEQGADLLRGLSVADLEAIATEMLTIDSVELSDLGSVASDFLTAAASQSAVSEVSSAGAMLHRAVGTEHARLLASRLPAPQPAARVPSLPWFDPASLAEALCGVHPQFAAAVLSMAPPDLGAAAFQRLPQDVQPAILRRISAMGELQAEALADVERFLAGTIGTVAVRDNFAPGGAAAAGRLLSKSSRSTQMRLLAELQAADPNLSASLSDTLFTFEDITGLESRTLQLVLREVDSDSLTTALRGCDAAARDRLLAGLSQRTAAAIRDDLADGSSVKVADVQAARKLVVSAAKPLADAGTIEIGSDDGE